MSKGEVQFDGTFRLATRDEDGVPAGTYKVVVTPPRPPDPANPPPGYPPFHPRFARYLETPLEYTVNPGPNKYAIRVAR
jgi:hypothetical protein